MTIVVYNPHLSFRWTPQPLLLVSVSPSNGNSPCWLLLSTTLLLVSFSIGCNCFFRLLGLALANNIWLLHPHLKHHQLLICLPYLSTETLLSYFPPLHMQLKMAIFSSWELTSERLASLSCPFLPESDPDSDSSSIPAKATFLQREVSTEARRFCQWWFSNHHPQHEMATWEQGKHCSVFSAPHSFRLMSICIWKNWKYQSL